MLQPEDIIMNEKQQKYRIALRRNKGKSNSDEKRVKYLQSWISVQRDLPEQE